MSSARIAKVCFATVLAVSALAVVGAQAEAAVNYFWAEKEVVVEANKEIKGTIETGTKFYLRGEVLGISAAVECSEAELKHAVIFSGLDSASMRVGRDSGELELKGCKISFCSTVSSTIKVPISGNGESMLVADAMAEENVTKVYNDTLPNATKEFAEFTVTGGLCGPGLTRFVISTTQARHGYGEAKEGESGVLAEIDGGLTEAAVEKKTHKITFICSNKEQLPQKAWNSKAEEIMVDKEQLDGKAACLEGKMVLELASKENFSVR